MSDIGHPVRFRTVGNEKTNDLFVSLISIRLLCGMGKFMEIQEARKEVKEKEKVRREKLAGFFFNLAQLTYTVLVLGAVVSFFQNFEVSLGVISMAIAGCITVIVLARIGNNFLK